LFLSGETDSVMSLNVGQLMRHSAVLRVKFCEPDVAARFRAGACAAPRRLRRNAIIRPHFDEASAHDQLPSRLA
jgi:hypothetical protein